MESGIEKKFYVQNLNQEAKIAVCLFVCMYVCMRVCAYIDTHIHMYITHMYIYIEKQNRRHILETGDISNKIETP